jgi:hypothetical protein
MDETCGTNGEVNKWKEGLGVVILRKETVFRNKE